MQTITRHSSALHFQSRRRVGYWRTSLECCDSELSPCLHTIHRACTALQVATNLPSLPPVVMCATPHIYLDDPTSLTHSCRSLTKICIDHVALLSSEDTPYMNADFHSSGGLLGHDWQIRTSDAPEAYDCIAGNYLEV